MSNGLSGKTTIRCPICFSENFVKRFTILAREAAQSFVVREGDAERHDALCAHIQKLWSGQDCVVCECSDCGFGFGDPFIAGDETFYRLAYERSDYPINKWEFERTAKELSALDFRAERVLEVGAGFGYFLDQIVDVYVSRSGVTALEFGDQAITALRQKGYFAIQDDLRTAKFHERFDAIFLFQVVEHMGDIESLFSRIRELLNDNGHAFISVPNPNRIKFNEQNGSLLDTPPNHIGRWSPAAFERVGHRHYLELQKYEIEPFSKWHFIKQDIAYSYLRRSQIAGTLANWSRSLRSRRYGKAFGAVSACLHAPSRLSAWRRAAQSRDLGGSLWVVLSKSQVI